MELKATRLTRNTQWVYQSLGGGIARASKVGENVWYICREAAAAAGRRNPQHRRLPACLPAQHHGITPPRPIQCFQCLATVSKTSKYVGKVLRVQPGSRMVTGTPQAATRENAIAMRWSSYVSIDTLGLICRKRENEQGWGWWEG